MYIITLTHSTEWWNNNSIDWFSICLSTLFIPSSFVDGYVLLGFAINPMDPNNFDGYDSFYSYTSLTVLFILIYKINGRYFNGIWLFVGYFDCIEGSKILWFYWQPLKYVLSFSTPYDYELKESRINLLGMVYFSRSYISTWGTKCWGKVRGISTYGVKGTESLSFR